MKKSINAWSVNPNSDFKEAFMHVSSSGFQGIELNLDGDGSSKHSLTMDSGKIQYKEINSLSEEYGLKIVSISTSLYNGQLGAPDAEARQKGKDILLKQLEIAEQLNADGILVVPGGMTYGSSLYEAYNYSLQTLSELTDEINNSKVSVCLENVWNGFFTSPFDMCRFIDELGTDYIKAYLDVGNMIAFSWAEYWIEILGSRIKKVHVKDFKRTGDINSGGDFVPLLSGDVNWNNVISMLRQIGFDGYLTAEVSPEAEESYTDFYLKVSNQLNSLINNY